MTARPSAGRGRLPLVGEVWMLACDPRGGLLVSECVLAPALVAAVLSDLVWHRQVRVSVGKPAVRVFPAVDPVPPAAVVMDRLRDL